MESQFLESFISVIKHGSIAGAARQLNLSPATLTSRLRALEQDFGAPLVQRSGRTVVATEAGARIFARAQSVVRDIDDLRSLAAGSGMIGQLRLGIIASAATSLLPKLLTSFDREHPGSRVHIQRGVSSTLYRAVCGDDLDAAIIVEPQFGIPKTCDWRRLNSEPLVLLTPKDLTVSDPHDTLARERLIRYDRNHWGGKLADEYLRRIGVEPQEYLELDALDSVAALVEEGLGVSLVPDWAGDWFKGRALAKHPLPLTGFQRNIGLLWSRSNVRIRQVQTLLGCAESVIGER